jgi:phosphoribosylpyrophosphate synthetase
LTRKSARLSARALAEFRFAVISEVRTRVLRGETRASAVRDVATLDHYGPDGRPWRVSARTVYRWFVFASEGRGVDALVPKPRTRTEASVVLDPAVLTFIHTEKLADPRASVPELIRRAVVAGLQSPLAGRQVLILDDVLETGTSLEAARALVLKAGASEVLTVVFALKPSSRPGRRPPDAFAWEAPDRFLVGYGMDAAGAYRTLPWIGALPEA